MTPGSALEGGQPARHMELTVAGAVALSRKRVPGINATARRVKKYDQQRDIAKSPPAARHRQVPNAGTGIPTA